MLLITEWFRRQLSNPQVVFLSLLLLALFTIVVLWGNMLAPVLASVVVAYLLEGIVQVLVRARIPRLVAVLIVFFVFLLFESKQFRYFGNLGMQIL